MAPKYIDVVNKIERELRRMKSEGISKLPSENDLCNAYSCSRQTVRSALKILEDKGLIVKVKGSGSFISDSAASRIDTVLLIVEDEDIYIFPDWIRRLRSSLSSFGLKLKVSSTRGSFKEEGNILTAASIEHYSSIVIDPAADMIPDPNESLIGSIRKSGTPVIYTTAISEDNEEGISILMHHLAEKGHRKIGGLFRIDDSRGLSRYRGCINASRELGLEFDETGYYLFTRSEQKTDSYIENFISGHLMGLSAVICQNDMVAYKLIKALTHKGIRVPDDVSVVSFDNSYYATKGDITITSLGHTFSTALTDTIVSLINGKKSRSNGPGVVWKLNPGKSS